MPPSLLGWHFIGRALYCYSAGTLSGGARAVADPRWEHLTAEQYRERIAGRSPIKGGTGGACFLTSEVRFQTGRNR